MPLGSSSRACSEAGCHLHSSEGLLQDAGLYTTGKKKKKLKSLPEVFVQKEEVQVGKEEGEAVG